MCMCALGQMILPQNFNKAVMSWYKSSNHNIFVLQKQRCCAWISSRLELSWCFMLDRRARNLRTLPVYRGSKLLFTGEHTENNVVEWEDSVHRSLYRANAFIESSGTQTELGGLVVSMTSSSSLIPLWYIRAVRPYYLAANEDILLLLHFRFGVKHFWSLLHSVRSDVTTENYGLVLTGLGTQKPWVSLVTVMKAPENHLHWAQHRTEL